mgnify:FL=1|jgi:hypothetical protein
MSTRFPVNWKPTKVRALEFMIANAGATYQEIADQAGVSKGAVQHWMKDPEFIEVFYQKYMISFGAKLPSVLNSMIREAEGGNVQAGRLVLEHSGKLIKRVEIQNHQSPFEKFLGTQESEVFQNAEVQEAEIVEDNMVVLPERPIIEEKDRVKRVEPPKSPSIRRNNRKNKKRREARAWNIRAKKVGLSPPKAGRQTPHQRKEWQKKIIEREKLEP